MNETERAALVAELAKWMRTAPLNRHLTYEDIAKEFIDRHIDRLLIDRDAEIREELEAEYERVKEENTGLMGDYDLETAGTLSGLSFAIGLTAEGERR